MKIKLSLSSLEMRANPSGVNDSFTDGEIVYGDGVLWYYDANPLIIPVSDTTGPQITNPDQIIGGGENDVIISDEIQVIVTPPAPPEHDNVIGD